jgi:cytochrome b
MESGLRRVRVWDLPTRAFHWVLAVAVVASVVSAKIGGNAMAWHFRCGYLIFTLLAFRIVWGLVGGRWSRFASFVHAPATVLRYLRGQVQPGERLDVGHNPLGALSVLALLVVLCAQVGTGLVADDEIANSGPLARFVAASTSSLATKWHHRFGQVLIIALVALHVAAVLFYLLRQRKNLIVPMLSGDKVLPADVPASTDGALSRVLAAAIVAACAAAVGWIASLRG